MKAKFDFNFAVTGLKVPSLLTGADKFKVKLMSRMPRIYKSASAIVDHENHALHTQRRLKLVSLSPSYLKYIEIAYLEEDNTISIKDVREVLRVRSGLRKRIQK